jgi:biopolymer transport protein ExbB
MSMIQHLMRRLTSLPTSLVLCLGLTLAAAPAAQAQTQPEPAASAAAAKPTAESSDNPYGLKAIVDHGDVVSKGVLGLLMIMSLGTWYVLVSKLLEQRKLLSEAKAVGAGTKFWTAGSLKQGSDGLAKEGAFRYMTETALEASKHHEGMLAGVDLSSWLTTSLDEAGEEVEHRMQKGLAFLATVGSTSPFIGLFGTVWGILNALTAIGVAGQASIDKVAGPVGEALIMTAIGLAVAVPAVLGYNWLVGRNTAALHYVSTFSSKLRATLLGATARA